MLTKTKSISRWRHFETLESRSLLATGDVFFALGGSPIAIDSQSPTDIAGAIDLTLHVQNQANVQVDAWGADVRITPGPNAVGTVEFDLPFMFQSPMQPNLPPASRNPFANFDLDSGGNGIGFHISDRLLSAANWVRLPSSTVPPTVDSAGNLTVPDGAGLASLPLSLSPDVSGKFGIVIEHASVSMATNPNDHDEFIDLPTTSHAHAVLDCAANSCTIVPDSEPPRVVSVKVSNSTEWSAAFRSEVDPDGIGYPIPRGSNQTDPLPWSNVTRIHVEFSEDVGSVTPSDFELFGVTTTDYGPLNVSYDPANHLATIEFDSALEVDKLLLIVKGSICDLVGRALDGDWIHAQARAESGNGRAGGDFAYRLNVLPGDVDQSGSVSVREVAALRTGLGTSVGDDDYDILADLNASGTLAINDLGPIRTNLGKRLPDDEPSATPAHVFSIPARDVDLAMSQLARAQGVSWSISPE